MLKALAIQNAWANHRLLGAVCQLSQAEFTAPATGFFGSIQATLNHILEVDRFYIDALEGGTLGNGAWDIPPLHTATELREAQQPWDQRLIAVCTDLPTLVTMHRGDRQVVDRADRIAMHLLQHQTHHRGQAHAMLSGTSVVPPQLDEFFCTHEAHLRASDLAAIGVSEEEIWGRK